MLHECKIRTVNWTQNDEGKWSALLVQRSSQLKNINALCNREHLSRPAMVVFGNTYDHRLIEGIGMILQSRLRQDIKRAENIFIHPRRPNFKDKGTSSLPTFYFRQVACFFIHYFVFMYDFLFRNSFDSYNQLRHIQQG